MDHKTLSMRAAWGGSEAMFLMEAIDDTQACFRCSCPQRCISLGVFHVVCRCRFPDLKRTNRSCCSGRSFYTVNQNSLLLLLFQVDWLSQSHPIHSCYQADFVSLMTSLVHAFFYAHSALVRAGWLRCSAHWRQHQSSQLVSSSSLYLHKGR